LPADDGKVVELAQRRGWRGAFELVPQYQIYKAEKKRRSTDFVMDT
jgi:hypothetical protein